MSDTRYSREDYARQLRRLVLFVDEADEEGSDTVQVHKDVLRLSAAMLSEAANRAPTHEQLVDRVDALEAPAAIMTEISR